MVNCQEEETKNKREIGGRRELPKEGRRVSCGAVYSSVWRPFSAGQSFAFGVAGPFATAQTRN